MVSFAIKAKIYGLADITERNLRLLSISSKVVMHWNSRIRHTGDLVWLIFEAGALFLAIVCVLGAVSGRLYFAFSPVWYLLVPWQKPGVPMELLVPSYIALVSGVLAFGRRNLAALFWAECSLIWSAVPIFVSGFAYLPLQWAFCALSVFTHLLPYKYGISTLTRSLVPIPGLLLLAHLPAYMISL